MKNLKCRFRFAAFYLVWFRLDTSLLNRHPAVLVGERQQ
jgi:hypothetical protein